MEIESKTADNLCWTLHSYSNKHKGLVFRKLNEECNGFDEAIVSETPYGWVCIDKKKRYIDVAETLKDAYFWLQEWE